MYRPHGPGPSPLDSPSDFSAEHGSGYAYAGTEFTIATARSGAGAAIRNPICDFQARRDTEQFDVCLRLGPSRIGRCLFCPVANRLHSTLFLTRRSIRWLAAAMKRRPIHVVCSSIAEQSFYTANGIVPQRCSLIRPGIEVPAETPDAPRTSQRSDLTTNITCCWAPGESTCWAEHLSAWDGWHPAMLDPNYRMLLWGRGPGRACSYRGLVEENGIPDIIGGPGTARPQNRVRRINSRRRRDRLRPVAGPRRSSRLQCMAASRPIIATATPWLGELLKDGQTLRWSPAVRRACWLSGVLELREESGPDVAVFANARAESKELFPMQSLSSDIGNCIGRWLTLLWSFSRGLNGGYARHHGRSR